MRATLTREQRRRMKKALDEAITRIGGPTKVGELFDPSISSQAVSQWPICPKDRVVEIASNSGVSATRLREDLYPRGTVLPQSTGARA